MEHIAGASGAVLGYIHGNTRGAIKGYKTARDFYKNKSMAAPKRKRATTVNKSRKRRTVGKSSNTTSSAAVVGSSRAVVRKVGRKAKGVVYKAKKTVKVTRAFRAKVAKATECKRATGYRQETNYQLMTFPSSNTQHSAYAVSGTFSGMFSPLRVAHVAAIMFNGKTDTLNPTSAQPGDFSSNSTKIEVQKQWVNFEMTNSTIREMTVKIYEIAPKIKQVPRDPLTEWNQGLSQDATVYQEVPASNLHAVGSSFVGIVPHSNKLFQQFFKVFERTIKLEPGQTHKWTCQGPSMTYDMSRYHVADTEPVSELWGPTRWSMVTYFPSMGVQTGKPGRFVDSDDPANSSHGLIVESVQHFVIKAPIVAGFKADASIMPNQTLDAQRDVYSYRNWVDSAGTATDQVHITSELQPMDTI